MSEIKIVGTFVASNVAQTNRKKEQVGNQVTENKETWEQK